MRIRTSSRQVVLATGVLAAMLSVTTAQAQPAAAPASGARVAAAPTGAVKVIAACAKAVYKPGHYIFTCADGGAGLKHASYTWWTHKTAHGTGTYYFNDCRPDCADGTLHYQHAEFSLYRV